MSPEANSMPRRENSSRVIAAGCAAGNWPTSLRVARSQTLIFALSAAAGLTGSPWPVSR